VVGESFRRVVLVREWLRTREEMEAGRATYRARNRRRGRSRMVYPPALAAVGNFPNWLQVKVREEMAAGIELPLEVTTFAFPPSPQILSFRSCKAYGNHFRVVVGDEDTGHTTFDSGIALIAEQGSRTSTADTNVKEAVLSYVGVLREIIRMLYDHTPVILFRGSWVPPQENGNAAIKRDKYGFWLANFNRRQRATEQPYAFPHQVRQVFFSEDAIDAGWKVVLQKDSRSSRVERPGDGVQLGAAPVNKELEAHMHIVGGVGAELDAGHVPEVVAEVATGGARVARDLRWETAWGGAWSSGESSSASDVDGQAGDEDIPGLPEQFWL
jgi:hypothetical protein